MRCAALVAVVAAATLAAGCGDDADAPAAKAKPVPQKLDANKDPREITCADLADKVASADLSRRATVALADELLARNTKFAKSHTRLYTSQSIFAGMAELCEVKEASFKPADEAVRGVEEGTYKVKRK